MKENTRNSNFELLRIISMFMIVFIHANMYLGQFCTESYRIVFNGVVNGVCNIGVTCFILISGYFGMEFKVSKLVKMECMMITYSLLETGLVLVLFPGQLQGAELLEALAKSCMPFITRKYWFYSCYICIYLFSGFIQKFVSQLEKKEFQKILAMLLLVFSVFPTLFYFEITQDTGKGLVQMFMIYLLGRYIGMCGQDSIPKRKLLVPFFALWLLNGISHELPIQIGGIYHHLCKDNSITNIIMAVLLFYLFKDLKFQSKWINMAATGLFAVFALNNTLVTVVMEWIPSVFGHWLEPSGVSGFLILMGIVLAILLVCILVGIVRETLLCRVDEKIGETLANRCS